MIKLSETVGPAHGLPEDVAPVQVMLARAKHRLRPFWRGEIDGVVTPALRVAIEMFQYETGILAPPLREDPGRIDPGGPTFTALKAAVPRPLLRMRVLPGTPVVYIAQRSSAVLQAELDWLRDEGPPHDAEIRADMARLIERCHNTLGVQLKVIDSRLKAGAAEFRLGCKALSLPLPGGVFHTVPLANPWLIPAAFWSALQHLAEGAWETPNTPNTGRGWLRSTRNLRTAA